MSGLIPVDRLYSIGVVVNDLSTAAAHYAEIFGIEQWDVRRFDAGRVSASTVNGRPTQPSFVTATGSTTASGEGLTMLGNPIGPVTFELIQPLDGESAFQELRFRRRQGVSHLTVSVADADEYTAIADALAQRGYGIAASLTVDGVVDRHFVDTRAALGGYLIEIQVPRSADGAVAGALPAVAVDEHWDLSATTTRTAGPLEVSGVNHFGVVVRDLMETLKGYAELLGIDEWNVRDWRTEPGGRGLEGSFYRGESVEHEYFTAMSTVADFGFEIVQPTFGPSHYNREFGDLYGEGLHHMLLTITADGQEWDGNQQWLESADVPLAMGADLFGGAGAFCYYDTFDKLGGYLVEAVLMKGMPEPQNLAPDYVIDFSTVAAG
ncbi:MULTISPECIES: VOC family protein [unclassified Gordonia (in: high G+C Gram-positive bacteria)]|uniref:VOC family protein n=1 Tax=unclassified Gordonia (in: high G+C Gram-positive bacteria) TaxID=2657482 RepID=UPI0009AD7F4A|nr:MULTISPECIES: VOC family protein [unclassified Gordonia (in: high G+C Gram-positive bacteria)]MDF3282992.1 VOC family protein [Gordonia sp. N1V]OPX10779.1 hypothetical protein B1964_23300 [Gordonia sp. i37]